MDKLTPRKTEILSASFEDIQCTCDPEEVKEKMVNMLLTIEEIEQLMRGSNNVVALRALRDLKEQALSVKDNMDNE